MQSGKKLYTVTDLGGGDGGKGGVVHKICDMQHAHTVIKVGGAQGSHGVRTKRGESFNFSQFGCGTFGGSRTHLSSLIVIDPNGILNEGQELKYRHGIGNVFDLLTTDEDALCITPYHGIASRLRELGRKDNPKGTIGIGVGEAFYDSALHPDLAIRAKDLMGSDLRQVLMRIRDEKIAALEPIIKDGFWDSDQEGANRQVGLLYDEGLVDWTIDRFREASKVMNIVDGSYLGREILSLDGTVVVESSHGILTDRYYGFHPHTSKLRTLPSFTHELIREAGYDGRVIKLGVTRAYQIRHGAGPMVTHSPEMVDLLLPGSNKDENRFQGKVRVGPLDLVALRYSIGVCGGPEAFDGLAISWYDQIEMLKEWKLCHRYLGADDETYFSPDGEIRIRRGADEDQLHYQEELGKRLWACRPEVSTISLGSMHTRQDHINLVRETLYEGLKVPVRMISFGSTEDTKVCF